MNFLSKIRLIIIIAILFTACSKQGKISLISKGKTAYSIYLDPSAPESVKNAAEELKSYFIKVTGISPEVLVSSQSPATPFISLGITSAAQAANTASPALKESQYPK